MSQPRFVRSYLGHLLGQATHALYRDFEAHVRAAGLSSTEWRVLAALHDSEPLTISELARDVLSKQPTVTKLVQRMVDQGWLRLRADASDQRRTLVTITASGRRLVLPLVERARDREAAVLSNMPAGEKAALKLLLGKLTALQASPRPPHDA